MDWQNVLNAVADQFHALLDCKERVLAVIVRDSDHHPIEQLDRALDNIQMTIGQWIKAARVNGCSHGADFNK